MASVIKQAQDGSKGIVVFTHKERPFLESSLPAVQDALAALEGRYVCGMNWGWYHKDVSVIPHIRFHLAGHDTLHLSADNPTPVIRMCSRDFIPDSFRPADTLKQWDLIAVGRCEPFKRHEDFLNIFRGLLDRKPDARALLMAPFGPARQNYADDLVRTANDLFNAEEQNRLDLMLPMILNTRKLFPVSHETMAWFYQSSRVYVHCAGQEGGSRTISEALLSGLPCIVRRDLKGGGRDYLTERNGRLYETLDEASTFAADLLNNPPDLTQDAVNLSESLSARHSKARLEQDLKALFERWNEPFAGDLAPGNYAMMLPSHSQLLPREWVVNPRQDDLKSPESLIAFIGSLTGYEPKAVDMARLRRQWLLIAGARDTKQRVRNLLISGRDLIRQRRMA